MKPSGPGLLFFGRFLITVSISVLVIGLLIFEDTDFNLIFNEGNFYCHHRVQGIYLITNSAPGINQRRSQATQTPAFKYGTGSTPKFIIIKELR